MTLEPKSIDTYLEDQEREADDALQRKYSGLGDIPVLLVFLTLFTVVFLQFFTRYILNDSLAWTEEAARYLLIILVFYGVIKCELLDSHIRLEFIDQLVGRRLGLLKQVASLLSIGYYGFLGYTVFLLAKTTHFQKMVSLPLPKYYFYIVLLIALFSLLCVQVYLVVKRLHGDQQ